MNMNNIVLQSNLFKAYECTEIRSRVNIIKCYFFRPNFPFESEMGYDADVTLLIEYRCDVIIYIAAVNYVCNV